MLHLRLVPLHLERDCIVASVEEPEGILHVRPTKRLAFFKLGSFEEARTAFRDRLCRPGLTLGDAIGFLHEVAQHDPQKKPDLPGRWYALLEGSSLSERGALLVLREGIAAIRSRMPSKGPWNWLGVRTLDARRVDGVPEVDASNSSTAEIVPFKPIDGHQPPPFEVVKDLLGDTVVPAPVKNIQPSKYDREHIRIQTVLLKIGDALGLKSCVAKNDGSTLYEGLPLNRHSANVVDWDMSVFSPATYAILTRIDVAYISKMAKIYAALFEVEHSTDIEKGVDRMLEVSLAYESFSIPMFVVAAKSRLKDYLKVLSKHKYKGRRDSIYFLEVEKLDEALLFIERAGPSMGVGVLVGLSTKYSEHEDKMEFNPPMRMV